GGSPACVVNGVVNPPEQCDDGNLVDGDGCDQDCTFSCVDPATDCPAAPPCQQTACIANHTCVTLADAAQNGTSCGPNATCKDGVCAAAVCGDGVVQNGEQCDFGAANGPNAGCEMNCTFSCTTGPDSCPDAETCNGVETCTAVMNGANVGQKCMPGVQALDCTACASGVCASGACKASTCGDGCIDPTVGEQCEPPSTVLCDAMCKTVSAATCGNAIREVGEDCDDGNQVNLDGCDGSCKFEQDLRSNYLVMQFGTDTFCGTVNQLGKAITAGVAGNQLQINIDQGISAGTTGFLAKMFGLASLVGVDDPSVEVGVVRGTPVAGASYNGVSDLDWWYNTNTATLDASRNPLDKLAGNITGGVLQAGPGSMTLPLNFFPGNATLLRLSGAKFRVSINAGSVPLVSNGTPPGHLASENLNPALQSFASVGQKDATFSGLLCGNISARSLAQAPIPSEFLPGGQLACTQGYSASNSLLDVITSGCSISPFGFPIVAINPTQPDEADPAAPVGGAGAPYKLTVNAQKVVTGCTDKNNASVNVSTCLDAAAYSSFFRFAMGRVILK
ncbi:MAG TPA: DUF4215 domain-containing protein, partial [Polyangium sp.]|nr:DUF4215 domain-containing protein [Polyangium sp.]